ncbi:MAG TPA: 16S rRNA (adenine(1518)-N(6)/adenine(1519)-N(6))-dimethyltransferase RsmA [Gammaproteobacteria bacterium]|nr:16S rRNA (adenine(1518)-N(6)/adenine(1519)-N(6))-dimethyltransferase RsmA [Gammaproteobacteria bacterium]
MAGPQHHPRHRPRKRFGQHFLHDPYYVGRIIAAIDPAPGEHLVEIGPGEGALTLPLLKHITQLDAVELDRDLIAPLQAAAEAQGAGTLRIHQADALRFDFCGELAGDGRPLRVVGNLPYNISTPLLFHLMGQRHCVRDMHFMLQKEVVDRITARPGEASYGRLGVMLAWYCASEALFTVPPGAFRPPPRVDSAVVRLVPHATPPVEVDEAALARVVSQAFAQRRKTLRNSLRTLLDADAIAACGIDPGRRPETLSLAEFATLANAVRGARGE